LTRFRVPLIIVLVSLFLVSSLPANASKAEKNLTPTHRHWLDVEVPYIISSVERKQFLALTTDSERDSFITAFWKIRNPNPGSETNSYKEEHYRRLTYANENFGIRRYEDGWRTDRGRMYIVLGAPKQRAQYHDVGNVRPMEIWFYESKTQVLPPYFYLLFFKPSASEDFRLYSPRFDGPVKLCSTGESRNDPVMALSIIKKALGEEVAKTAITLLPNEHVDMSSFDPGMESDSLLTLINGLPDNPITRESLDANRLREHVTMSVLSGETPPELTYTVVRDDKGAETVNYLLKLPTADPQLVGPGPDNTLRYDLSLRTSVLTTDGKSVYEQEDLLTGRLTEAAAMIARQKRFAAEGRLPLVPGKYVVVATLTNNLNQVATRQHAQVTAPEPKSHVIGISPLLAYAAPAATPDPDGTLPFSASKMRFTPRAAQAAYIRQGEKLPLVFQIWLDPCAAVGCAGAPKLHLHYVFGAITASHDTPAEEDEEIDSNNRDAAGNLLTGHTVDTSSLTPGSYMLVVRANQDGTQQSASASMTLHVEPADSHPEAWTAYGPTAPDEHMIDDLKRGLSAEALGADAEAQSFYTKALDEGHGDLRPLDKLAALLSRLGQTQDLAALSQQPVLSEIAVAPTTLLPIAQALTKRGNPKAVVRMLGQQIKLQPPNADLYRALADACEATGDKGRARDMRALADGTK
jgi:GWxTD domain-containing protein